MGDSERRVLFVDDEPMVLDVLRLLLAREPYEVHTARSAEDARRILAERTIRVLVVDAHMPNTNGVDLLREVREAHPDVVRIMMTGSSDVETAMFAVNDGAVFRFLVKPTSPAALRQAIADALEHGDKKRKEAQLIRLTLEQQSLVRELYGGDGLVPKVAAKSDDVPAAVAELLSPREVEVALALVRVGDADGVARSLSVSPHTVRTHLKSMFKKLDVHSQSALVSRLYGLGVRP